MSCGLTLASTVRLSASGTISMIASPAVITPPTVWTVGLEYGAVLRRADVDALELILGGDLALDELADLAVDLARLLGDLAAEIAIDLQDLQLGLGDLAADLGGLRDQLPGFAFQARRLALQFGQLGELDQLLLPQLVDAVLLAIDQLDFLFLGLALGVQAADFLV